MNLAAEIKRLKDTFTWSVNGWRAAWASEKSLRQWVVINILSVALAFYLDLRTGERALLLALGVLILVAELFNTAIEELADHVSEERHPRLGKVKDCCSAAVALTALAGGLAWAVILID